MSRALVPVLIAAVVLSAAQTRVAEPPYVPANYAWTREAYKLRLFPEGASAVEIAFLFHLDSVRFGPDGRSMYGTYGEQIPEQKRGVWRIELPSNRTVRLPGTDRFAINDFAVSARQENIVVSGAWLRQSGSVCGLFEIGIPSGNVRQILSGDCNHASSWRDLSISPDPAQAIATAGSRSRDSLHLEIIDLVHGTTRTLSTTFSWCAWSPDGRWIAALRDRSVYLLDPHDFTNRRRLGITSRAGLSWSPDSQYLLTWKYYPFRCGFYLDVEAPATFEIIEVKSGRRTTIKSSRCQLMSGPTGWLSSEIANGPYGVTTITVGTTGR